MHVASARRGPVRQARAALGHLLVHVGHVEARDLADRVEDRDRVLGLVGMHVHAERALVADHEHGVADRLEPGHERAGLEPGAGDGEVRAVAVARRLVLGAVQRRRRDLVLELGRGAAPERGEAPRHDHGQAVGTGIDHAGVPQHGELIGSPLHGLRARLERVLEHLGEQLVLLLGARLGAEPLLVHVREVVRHAAGHRADRREHRALGRVAHRRVGGVGRARERRGHEHRIHQLALAARELLGRAAHDLGEDHAAVAARAQQRGAGNRRHDLVPALPSSGCPFIG